VRTCCIGPARRCYAATVNSACQDNDLQAPDALAQDRPTAIDLHVPQDQESIAESALAGTGACLSGQDHPSGAR
jgi:hypothetical protein